jgi:hypothetical protein
LTLKGVPPRVATGAERPADDGNGPHEHFDHLGGDAEFSLRIDWRSGRHSLHIQLLGELRAKILGNGFLGITGTLHRPPPIDGNAG